MVFRCQKLLFLGVALLASLFVNSKVFASPNNPSFKQAVAGAELILQGDMVDTSKPVFEDSKKDLRGLRCYRFLVKKCYKGGLASGVEVLFWDRGYSPFWVGVPPKGECVIYLKEQSLSEHESKLVNRTGHEFYRLIRVQHNQKKYAGPQAAELYTREQQLLDLFVVNPPADKRAAYRALIENNADAILLSYVVVDWPHPLTDEDVALFKRTVLARKDSPAFVRRMLKDLVRHPDALTNSDIALLLEKHDSRFFFVLSPLINKENIQELQEQLFRLIQNSDTYGWFHKVVEMLATLAPDYFKEQLIASDDLALCQLVPCLKALGLNGSDIGIPDFSEEVFSVSHQTLMGVSHVLEGGHSSIGFPLLYPAKCKDWVVMFPLLEPLVERPEDSPQRRACVALLRSSGVPVVRTGRGYSARLDEAPVSCPVKLELRMNRANYKLGEDVYFLLKETADSAGDFCFEGKSLMTLHYEGGSHSAQSLLEDLWKRATPSKDEFIVLEKGMSEERELKLFRAIERPGNYRITLSKCYPHDGGKYGVDAWTGMVFAENELVFVVEEP